MFKKPRQKSPYYLAAIDFGYTLLASVGVFGWVGWWLDGKYQTLPLFLIGGIFLGLAVGFNSLFKRINLIDKTRKAEKDRAKKEPPEPKP